MRYGVIYGLLAAVLFGASTPVAKILVVHIHPVMFAGLLYFSSGLGLWIYSWLRALALHGKQAEQARLSRSDLPWMALAILTGGIGGPVLLMLGLTLTSASTSSLLLNLESVFTALLAWFVFKEHFDRRIFLGMTLIVAACIILSWDQSAATSSAWGPLLIMGACLCWALDNNFTRKVSASDAVQIASIKGLAAGSVNLSIALCIGAKLPDLNSIVVSGVIGFLGYGVSLVMFVLALRHLGSARTGAYFSLAPFIGAAISLVFLQEIPSMLFWLAAVLMGLGLWLHLSEHHAHSHFHERTKHNHSHYHDPHHLHSHDFKWDGREPHTHEHDHEPIEHIHAHFPDIHHRHAHK